MDASIRASVLGCMALGGALSLVAAGEQRAASTRPQAAAETKPAYCDGRPVTFTAAAPASATHGLRLRPRRYSGLAHRAKPPTQGPSIYFVVPGSLAHASGAEAYAHNLVIASDPPRAKDDASE